MLRELVRELRFSWRESPVRWTIFVAFCFVVFSLVFGLQEVQEQKRLITDLVAENEADQAHVLDTKADPGEGLCYVFHLTYDPPTALASTALGLRDELPWKHRLNLLALEGQIYESDASNPELALLGKLDFAHFVAFLLPLFVIGLLYDLDARERREARYELVSATSVSGKRLFLSRAVARALLLFGAIGLPFAAIALPVGASFAECLAVLGIVLAHIAVWLVIARLVTRRNSEGVSSAVWLLSVWLGLAVVGPVIAKVGAERVINVPQGGDILLTQREKVNDAWDLPKSATMEPFLETHPGWSSYAAVDRPFEWKWYYAFQQVGDQTAQPISTALYRGMLERDAAIGRLALFSPPLLVDRAMTKLARTDVSQHLRYVSCARAFHASLRRFHYPMLFEQEPDSKELLTGVPEYQPCEEVGS